MSQFKKMKWFCRRKRCNNCRKFINYGEIVYEISYLDTEKQEFKSYFTHKDCHKDCHKLETIQQRFVRFLKEEGVFEIYRENLKKRCSAYPQKAKKVNLITHAFDWWGSVQGQRFWNEIDNIWLRIIKSEAL